MTADSKPANDDNSTAPATAHQAVIERESLYLRALMEHFPERIYFKDRQSRFVFGNRSFLAMFNLDRIEELYGKSDFDFFAIEHAQAAYNDEQEILRTLEAVMNKEERETWPDGRVTWCSSTKAPFRDEHGEVVGTLGISRDITPGKQAQEALRESEQRYRMVSEQLADANRQLAEANQALNELSLTDPLTGLRNRRFLANRMPDDIAQVERAHRLLAHGRHGRFTKNVDLVFLMVDLDHFKRVNDLHGHAAGDRVLQQMAEILRKAARTSDTVARVGGEEFLVVARQTEGLGAQVVAERIRAMVEGHLFDVGEPEPLRVTCSVGFSVYPVLRDDTAQFSWEQVMSVADQCLYAVKRGGRNGWVGVLPGEGAAGAEALKEMALPERIPEMVRKGILPLATSLPGPVEWA
jgi:diguanylate cyclase (GGDEF)-like protein/PAS domain S-box-containing protein